MSESVNNSIMRHGVTREFDNKIHNSSQRNILFNFVEKIPRKLHKVFKKLGVIDIRGQISPWNYKEGNIAHRCLDLPVKYRGVNLNDFLLVEYKQCVHYPKQALQR